MNPAQLRLNLPDGSVAFRFSPEAARDLQGAIATLMERLKAVAMAGSSGGDRGGDRPSPQPSVEYQHTGDVFLEIFCNPNIWPSPFAAKVLITVRDDRIRLSTEAELTRLMEDLNEYLAQYG
jgi:hypothetical protein